MVTERKRIINPYEVRLAQSAILETIRKKTLRPSSLIKIMEGEQNEIIKSAMIDAFNEFAPVELKEKVIKVRSALETLNEFDKP